MTDRYCHPVSVVSNIHLILYTGQNKKINKHILILLIFLSDSNIVVICNIYTKKSVKTKPSVQMVIHMFCDQGALV